MQDESAKSACPHATFDWPNRAMVEISGRKWMMRRAPRNPNPGQDSKSWKAMLMCDQRQAFDETCLFIVNRCDRSSCRMGIGRPKRACKLNMGGGDGLEGKDWLLR